MVLSFSRNLKRSSNTKVISSRADYFLPFFIVPVLCIPSQIPRFCNSGI
ncbi:hypothetical protein HMPREF9347_04793 [Escherichia coli MS 124-1]|nr:hypothetical protein HMPREF9347_04793 [Escherichia coli MS 124-1]